MVSPLSRDREKKKERKKEGGRDRLNDETC